MWFNPPYSANIKTNVGRAFFSLMAKHFNKDPLLIKLFNKNNLKLSYGAMPSIGAAIKCHNNKIISSHKSRIRDIQDERACN